MSENSVFTIIVGPYLDGVAYARENGLRQSEWAWVVTASEMWRQLTGRERVKFVVSHRATYSVRAGDWGEISNLMERHDLKVRPA